MTDRSDRTNVSRRNVLRTGVLATGVALFAGATVAGGQSSDESQGGDEDDTERGLAARIESYGHYAWFPMGPDTWGRSSTPVDAQADGGRWMVQPTADGAVRTVVEDLPADRNAGFDLHLGRLGAIDEVTVTSEAVRTTRGTSPTVLLLGLYLDQNDDDDFFEWETDGGADQWVGFGGDDEGVLFSAAGGAVTVGDDTEFFVAGAEQSATLAQLKDGTVDGIDSETAAGLYVGVASNGQGVEEALVQDVSVERS
jgi:hypothetical protein